MFGHENPNTCCNPSIAKYLDEYHNFVNSYERNSISSIESFSETSKYQQDKLIANSISHLLNQNKVETSQLQETQQLLISASFLFLDSFFHNDESLLSKTVSIFDNNHSFYLNNEHKYQSIIEYFIRSKGIEQIIKNLEDSPTTIKFYYFSKFIGLILKTSFDTENLRSIFIRILTFLADFLTHSTNVFDTSLLYSSYFELASQIFSNSQNFSIFLNILKELLLKNDLSLREFYCEQAFNLLYKLKTSECASLISQYLAITTFSEDSIDLQFIISLHNDQAFEYLLYSILLNTSKKIQISDLSNQPFDQLYKLFNNLFENFGFDAFTPETIGYLIDQFDQIDYSNVNTEFLHFLFRFIVLQNIKSKKIYSNKTHIFSQFIIKKVPLDYENLLFKVCESSPINKSLFVDLYRRVDPICISETIETFQKRLEQCNNDDEFVLLLTILLEISKAIEDNADLRILGIYRHLDQRKRQYSSLAVNVSHPNGILRVNCDLFMTIRELISIVAIQLQYKPEPLRLYLDSQWLKEKSVLSEYKIAQNTQLVLGGTLQPMPTSCYPTVIFSEVNFASYLLESSITDSKNKQKVILDFLNFLQSTDDVLPILTDGNYFIAQIRNSKSIVQLQYIISLSCLYNNDDKLILEYIKCNVFEILCRNLLNNKFGSEGIRIILSFLESFIMSSYSCLPPDFVVSLLTILSGNGNDDLYKYSVSLLFDYYSRFTDSATKIINSNLKLLAKAILRNEESYQVLKDFLFNYQDKNTLFFLAISYNSLKFQELASQLPADDRCTKLEYVCKGISVLEQLDENEFPVLFNHLMKLISTPDFINQNIFIIDALLNIVLDTESETIQSIILTRIAEMSTVSLAIKQSLNDFITAIASITFKETEKVDDISVVLKMMSHIFPLNYLLMTSKNESIKKLFEQMAYSSQILECCNNHEDPIHIYENLLKEFPSNCTELFNGELQIEIEGDDIDFYHQSDEAFSYLTIPAIGFSNINESIHYLFTNTDHYIGDTQYYVNEYDMKIDASKSMKLKQSPPILVLKLSEKLSSIAILQEIDLSDLTLNEEKTKYAFSCSIVYDCLQDEYYLISKTNNNWYLYSNNQSKLLNSNEFEKVLSNSYLVVYTRIDLSAKSTVHGIETTLDFKHPFDLLDYIDNDRKEELELFKKKKKLQTTLFNNSISKFMLDNADRNHLFKFFISTICHSKDSLFSHQIYQRLESSFTPNEILLLINSEFSSIISVIDNPYLIDLISYSMQGNSYTIIHKFLEYLPKCDIETIPHISQLILNFVLSSTFHRYENSQELIWTVSSIYQNNTNYSEIDLTYLFNALSILINSNNQPSNSSILNNLQNKILQSEFHKTAYLTVLKALDSPYDISAIVNDFINGNITEIPPEVNVIVFLHELSNYCENRLLIFQIPHLVKYLVYKDASIRRATKKLIHSIANTTGDDQIIQILSSCLNKSEDCYELLKLIIQFISKTGNKSQYISLLFNIHSFKSTKDISPLLQSFYKLFDEDILINNNYNIINNFTNCNSYVDFILDYSNKLLCDFLNQPNCDFRQIDSKHKYLVFKKLFEMDNEEFPQFVSTQICTVFLNDDSYILLNSFLEKFIELSISTVFAKLNQLIQKANESHKTTYLNQYYLGLIVKICDNIINHEFNSYQICLNQLIQFFYKFWRTLASDSLLKVVIQLTQQNQSFCIDLLTKLDEEIQNRVEINEKENWVLSIIYSYILFANRTSLHFEDDEQFTNELKYVYDLSCQQHSRLTKATSHQLFEFYLQKLEENSLQTWPPILALKLLPESHFLSDKEREFYSRSFELIKDFQKDTVIDALINPPIQTQPGSLDIQRYFLVATQKPEFKQELMTKTYLKKIEALDMAIDDWYLEKYVSQLYGEHDIAALERICNFDSNNSIDWTDYIYDLQELARYHPHKYGNYSSKTEIVGRIKTDVNESIANKSSTSSVENDHKHNEIKDDKNLLGIDKTKLPQAIKLLHDHFTIEDNEKHDQESNINFNSLLTVDQESHNSGIDFQQNEADKPISNQINSILNQNEDKESSTLPKTLLPNGQIVKPTKHRSIEENQLFFDLNPIDQLSDENSDEMDVNYLNNDVQSVRIDKEINDNIFYQIDNVDPILENDGHINQVNDAVEQINGHLENNLSEPKKEFEQDNQSTSEIQQIDNHQIEYNQPLNFNNDLISRHVMIDNEEITKQNVKEPNKEEHAVHYSNVDEQNQEDEFTQNETGNVKQPNTVQTVAAAVTTTASFLLMKFLLKRK